MTADIAAGIHIPTPTVNKILALLMRPDGYLRSPGSADGTKNRDSHTREND
jgi:hypothetical protein